MLDEIFLRAIEILPNHYISCFSAQDQEVLSVGGQTVRLTKFQSTMHFHESVWLQRLNNFIWDLHDALLQIKWVFGMRIFLQMVK